MLLALAFDPIFVYIALAFGSLLGLARLLIGWATLSPSRSTRPRPACARFRTPSSASPPLGNA
jgi:hypothetical protein